MPRVETGERLVAAVRRLVADLFPGGPPFALRLWNGETIAPASGASRAGIWIRDPGSTCDKVVSVGLVEHLRRPMHSRYFRAPYLRPRPRRVIAAARRHPVYAG